MPALIQLPPPISLEESCVAAPRCRCVACLPSPVAPFTHLRGSCCYHVLLLADDDVITLTQFVIITLAEGCHSVRLSANPTTLTDSRGIWVSM